MKVMLYTPAVPVEAGGVQAVFSRVAEGLAERGHDVRRVWPIPHYRSTQPRLDDYFPHLDDWPGLRSVRQAKESARLFRRLVGGLRRHRPDVVNIHFVRPGSRYFFRLRRAFGYRIVLTFHGSDALCPDPREAVHLRRMIRNADGVTAVSPLIAERIREVVDDPRQAVTTIPNGIDYPFWSQTVDPPTSKDSRPMILAVGRLMAVKDHANLIEAVSRLRRDGNDVRLRILGDGECEAALRAQIAELDLSSAVELAGRADADEIRRQLALAAVYVLPSLSEGMPLSLLEAMAAGVASVATEVGGVPLLAEGGAAHLVPPSEPAALAAALKTLMSEPSYSRKLQQRGRQRAAEYTHRSMISGYETLLSRTLGTPTVPLNRVRH
jgi:glycosyltransferase involved in cell wall biosynthesis